MQRYYRLIFSLRPETISGYHEEGRRVNRKRFAASEKAFVRLSPVSMDTVGHREDRKARRGIALLSAKSFLLAEAHKEDRK
jgi:hypothetical protein